VQTEDISTESMADYFRRLASYANLNHLAIVDPVSSQSSTPRKHSYAQLLLRVNVFHESLIAAAQEAQRPLEGARVGLMVPPGLDFIAALLAVWSVRAIVGMTCRSAPDHVCDMD
jgi:acyl-CoA synthetase (AMP-forming)/AMP-acid ligase II